MKMDLPCRLSEIALAFALGFVAHDVMRLMHVESEAKHVYTLTHVLVRRQDGNDAYQMQLQDTHELFEAKFCPDYLPPLEEGMLLKLLVYEDKGTCWSVRGPKLGYLFVRDEKGIIVRQKGD